VPTPGEAGKWSQQRASISVSKAIKDPASKLSSKERLILQLKKGHREVALIFTRDAT